MQFKGTDRDAVIIDAARTPLGKKKGSFAEVRADQLGAHVLSTLVERNGLDPAALDDVITGCVTQTGEQGINISRMIALTAGLPVSVTGASVNRLCGSSLQALSFGAAQVRAGFHDVVACLGAESMTRVPMGSDAGSMSPEVQARFSVVPQGESAELICDRYGLGRAELDALSVESHKRAVAARDAGKLDREIVASFGLERDETPRPTTSLEKLAGLAPSFRGDGRIHAGSSSQISDGAAGLLVTSQGAAKRLGMKPRARIVTAQVAGGDPVIGLTAPAPATRKALDAAGLKLDQLDAIECNEAFASVPLAFARELGIDAERLNPRGGAIALGHPLGATGARLATTLLHTLEDEGGRYGLATMCIGFGQGIAVIIENLNA
jgi:acetyl-CoA acetyltransferase family protein